MHLIRQGLKVVEMGVVGRVGSLAAGLKAAGVAMVQKRKEEASGAMRWGKLLIFFSPLHFFSPSITSATHQFAIIVTFVRIYCFPCACLSVVLYMEELEQCLREQGQGENFVYMCVMIFEWNWQGLASKKT